jgi:hypothetical protein
VAADLWEVLPDGWGIHDWEAYQPTREQVEAKRDSVSAKRAEAGRKGAESRWGNGKNGKRDGKPMANAWQTDGPVPSRPVPTPDTPVVTGHLSARNARARESDDDQNLASFFGHVHVDPDTIREAVRQRLGLALTDQEVFGLYSDLSQMSTGPIRNGQAYILAAIRDTPFEVQKLIHARRAA